jgi:hypothetical protein
MRAASSQALTHADDHHAEEGLREPSDGEEGASAVDKQFSSDHHHSSTDDEKAGDLEPRCRSAVLGVGVEDGRAPIQPEHQAESRHHEQCALDAAHHTVVPEDEREEDET